MNRRSRWVAYILIALIAISSSGCALLRAGGDSFGAAFAYERALLPENQVELDLAYYEGESAHSEKHRLDFFRPTDGTQDWPTLVFVHGGGWTEGDRATRMLGIEPMRNIGRFYAARGFGVAVISYRLQPSVSWRAQVEDVARSVEWVERHVATHGGNPDALYVSGHSAGAWLAAWVGLAESPLAERGLSRSKLCGLVLVSGAGYDLVDEETYALGASREYFEERFKDERLDWAETASIARQVTTPVPPSLILSAKGEGPRFERQGNLLFDRVQRENPASRRVIVPGQGHQQILVSMSRAGDPVSEAVLEFFEQTQDCGRDAEPAVH